MKLKLSYGRNVLFSEFAQDGPVRLGSVLQSIKASHPEIHANWCDNDGQLRSSLPAFINNEHISYKDGMETELFDGDEVYIVPLIAGG